jgi:integrase
MAIGKPRGREGMRPVYVYDPRVKRKVYVGSRKNLRGKDGAQDLERRKAEEFNLADRPATPTGMTCDEYADRWLVAKHGPGTRRPSPTTLQVNRGYLRKFRDELGDRLLDGGISRVEALDWARANGQAAKTVSAMFNDAVDDMLAAFNPFANRRLPEGRGRKDIAPLTEHEVSTLGELAIAAHGELYGVVVAAWITFLAWTGCRPGEAFTRSWSDLDLKEGRVTVPRIKGDKRTSHVVLPQPAIDALLAKPGPRCGLLFTTTYGRPYSKGNASYYWRPVRSAFVAQLKPRRRRELLAVKGALDVYALRHFCGSLMADRGLTEFDIAHQLGNSPEVCRDTYIHTHVDRANERISMALEPTITELQAARRRRAARDDG